jgi:hypothetical protein
MAFFINFQQQPVSGFPATCTGIMQMYKGDVTSCLSPVEAGMHAPLYIHLPPNTLTNLLLNQPLALAGNLLLLSYSTLWHRGHFSSISTSHQTRPLLSVFLASPWAATPNMG